MRHKRGRTRFLCALSVVLSSLTDVGYPLVEATRLETQIWEFLRNNLENSEETEDLIVAGYEYLANSTNVRIRRLSTFMLKAFRHNCVTAHGSPKVNHLSFALVNRNKVFYDGLILAPEQFFEDMQQTPIGRLGELVYIASHVTDFLSNRFDDQLERVNRAKAYEVEYLNTVKRIALSWSPETYQTKIFKEYPEGLDTPGVRWYSPKFIES